MGLKRRRAKHGAFMILLIALSSRVKCKVGRILAVHVISLLTDGHLVPIGGGAAVLNGLQALTAVKRPLADRGDLALKSKGLEIDAVEEYVRRDLGDARSNGNRLQVEARHERANAKLLHACGNGNVLKTDAVLECLLQ